VRRAGLLAAATAPRLVTSVLDTGETFDIPLAQHGFAMLVTVTHAGQDHRLLFDAGMKRATDLLTAPSGSRCG
jgi:hypothetical protein